MEKVSLTKTKQSFEELNEPGVCDWKRMLIQTAIGMLNSKEITYKNRFKNDAVTGKNVYCQQN